MDINIWNAYKNFRCIAQRCPDSCCKDWVVDVDDASADYYRSLQGELGDRLRQVLQNQDSEWSMILENGRCPMWRTDGLCRIQAEQGHDRLCKVCREYPRLYQHYGDFAEWGLEMSCPEAARLIFEDVGAQVNTQPESEKPEYDKDVMDILQKSREEILSFLTETKVALPQALAVMLLFGYQVQNALDGGEYVPLQPENCLKAATKYAQTGNANSLLQYFLRLEVLTDRWKSRLQNPSWGKWTPKLHALAVYLVRRYWLQAVWDWDLICRVKLIIASCILVNILGEDPIETAQLFSKEIENDPDNLESILNDAYSVPALTDANLLGLLFNSEKAGKTP